MTPLYNETTKLTVNDSALNPNNVDDSAPNQTDVDDSAPNQTVVTELTPIQLEVEDLTLIPLTGAEGRDMPPPPGSLILGTTQYDDDDDDLSGKCLNVEGKFKSPKEDTVPVTNSHTSDTASNSHKSLTTVNRHRSPNKYQSKHWAYHIQTQNASART